MIITPISEDIFKGVEVGKPSAQLGHRDRGVEVGTLGWMSAKSARVSQLWAFPGEKGAPCA